MGSMHYSITDADQMVRAFDAKGARSLNLTEFIKLNEFLTAVTVRDERQDKGLHGS